MRFPRRRGTRYLEAMRHVEPPEPQLSADGSQTVRKLPVSTDDLRKAWAVSRRVSKDDWMEWYKGLCREFLKASPSPALRACWTVAQRYDQLAKDLFNASFVSCWTELDANQQDELMSSLEKALTEPDLPEISQVLDIKAYNARNLLTLKIFNVIIWGFWMNPSLSFKTCR